MSEDDPIYVGNLTHPDFGADPVVGRMSITHWSLRFEAEGMTLDFPLSGLRFEPPDSEDDPVAFRHPEFPGCVMTASNADLFSHRVFTRLTNLRSQLERVAVQRHDWGRVKATALFLVAFAAISVSVIWVFGRVVDLVVQRVPLAEENKLGAKALAEVKAKRRLLDDQKTVAELTDLVQRLQKSRPPSRYEYQIVLLNDSEPNACALPGGVICVNSGLLKLADTPEQVAGVLAHEMAHVERRHGLRHLISGVGPLYLLGLLFGKDEGLAGAIAGGSEVLIALRFSRAYEQEADDFAWQYLEAANIDPRGLPTFLQKMYDWQPFRRLGLEPNRALSTHPPTPARIERLEARWKKESKKDGFVHLPPLKS